MIQAATVDFMTFSRREQYHFYISDLVLGEVERTKDAFRRKRLLNVIHRENMRVLTISKLEQELAQAYIHHKVMASGYLPDALHIAIAVTHKIPILVSWNFKHMVRHHTRVLVNEVNKKLGYSFIDICSPQEV